jgi:hypothetical protein
MDNDPVAAEIARHIAAIINQQGRLTDDGIIRFTATHSGDLVHVNTYETDEGLQRKADAWVLTVEWDGER